MRIDRSTLVGLALGGLVCFVGAIWIIATRKEQDAVNKKMAQMRAAKKRKAKAAALEEDDEDEEEENDNLNEAENGTQVDSRIQEAGNEAETEIEQETVSTGSKK